MSTSTFLHHYWLLFNFHLVTGRSIGIFFSPFKRSLCCPETLHLLSAAFHPTFQLQFVRFGEAGRCGPHRWGRRGAAGPSCVTQRQFLVSTSLTETSVYLNMLHRGHLFPVDISHPGVKVDSWHIPFMSFGTSAVLSGSSWVLPSLTVNNYI